MHHASAFEENKYLMKQQRGERELTNIEMADELSLKILKIQNRILYSRNMCFSSGQIIWSCNNYG